MFDNYTKQVIADYEKKRASNELPSDLLHPTAAKLKKACMGVYITRPSKKDERLLIDFFEVEKAEHGYEEVIKDSDVDKFRPLLNFLNGKTSKPDERVIEVLAWLIDFPGRPFVYYKRYDAPAEPSIKKEESFEPVVETNERKDEVLMINSNTVGGDLIFGGKQNVKTDLPQHPRRYRRDIALAVCIALISGIAGYKLWNKETPMRAVNPSDSCMYWSGDQYVRISCNQKVKYATVIALDTELLNNFMKITRPDTITLNDIGRIWYTKIKGEPEFYTAMGYHPTETRLQLKPITEYIIDKYIFKTGLQNAGDKDSRLANATVETPGNDGASLQQSKTLLAPGSYGQCQGITKKGTQCSRNAKANGFCWQHGG